MLGWENNSDLRAEMLRPDISQNAVQYDLIEISMHKAQLKLGLHVMWMFSDGQFNYWEQYFLRYIALFIPWVIIHCASYHLFSCDEHCLKTVICGVVGGNPRVGHASELYFPGTLFLCFSAKFANDVWMLVMCWWEIRWLLEAIDWSSIANSEC